MNQEMSTLFPNGIRALVVDDDARFLTSACMMLSILDFKVTTCASPTTALNLLTREKIKAVNVVLANAAKVAACGFDFRGIVESDLFIPVVYFLPLDHKATGDEADELLRTLQAATYIIKKPLDAGQVCDLWKDIAWRMCCLDAKANQAGRNRVVPAAGGEASGSAMVGEREDEERIHFKVVKTGGSSRKRKSTGNPGGSSGTSLAGDDPAKKQKEKNVTEGQERGNVASQKQERRSIKAKKDDGKAPELQEPQAMEGQHPGQQHNPVMFADTVTPSTNNVAAGNTTSSPALPPVNAAPCPVHSAAMSALVLPPAPAQCPVHSPPEPSLPAPVNPVSAPAAPSRVYPAQPPAHQAPALQPAAHNVFDTTALMPAVTTMAATITSTPQFMPWSQGSWIQRRGTGPIMISFQRQSPAGDPFTGMASGVLTFGASGPASATAADAGTSYGNEASLLIQSLNLGTDEHDKLNPPLPPQNAAAGAAASNEVAMAAAMYSDNYCARALMAPHHIGRGVAANEAVNSGGYIDYSAVLAMARHQQVGHGVGVTQEEAATGMEEATNSNSFSNHSSGSSHMAFNTEDCFSNYSAASHSHMAAPDQVVGNGMASNVNELTMAGGTFGSSNVAAAPSMALEVEDPVVAAPNGNQQLAPGVLLDNIYEPIMEPQGPAGVVMDGNAASVAEMFPGDQCECEENIMFSLEDLLGHGDQQEQGGTTGGAAVDADAAGSSMIRGEGDGEIWDNTMFTVEDLLGQDGQQGGATGGAAADATETSLIGGEGNDMFTVEDLLGLEGQQGGAGGAAAAAAVGDAGTSLIGGEEDEGAWDITDNLDDFFVATGGAAAATNADDFFVATGGATTAAMDGAGTSLIGGEDAEGTWDIGAADNLDDFFVGDLWNINMPSYDANNGCE